MVSPVDSRSEGLAGSAAVRSVAMPSQSSLPESLAQELQELESMVGRVQDRLDPGTVEVLERNLLLIERAIEDSYQALAGITIAHLDRLASEMATEARYPSLKKLFEAACLLEASFWQMGLDAAGPDPASRIVGA